MRRWDFRREIDRKNAYQAGLKGRVLERVALSLQKRSESAGDVSERDLIGLISEALPDIGVASAAAEGLLREIVRNSGIIIYVAPAKLRFAHLTFQEFFAAREIEATSSEQTMLPNVAPNWREVAILFCGISKRAGSFVSQLKNDPKFAAACIAESVAVPFSVARSTLDMLQLESETDPTCLVSIAGLAVNTKRPWAANALSLLRACTSNPNRSVANSAISALATVPTSEVAEVLVHALSGETEGAAREALKQVGGSALPALQAMLRSGVSERISQICLELCSYVRMPEVVDLLLPILWSPKSSGHLVFAAGRSLGILLRDSTIEEAVRLTKKRDIEVRLQELTGPSSIHPELSSKGDDGDPLSNLVSSHIDQDLGGNDNPRQPIWPFPEDNESILPATARRIVDVLAINDYRKTPDQEYLDPRIAIPLSIVLLQKGTPSGDLWQLFLGKDSHSMRTIPPRALAVHMMDPIECLAAPVEGLWKEWAEITREEDRNGWVCLMRFIQYQAELPEEPGEFTKFFKSGFPANRPNVVPSPPRWGVQRPGRDPVKNDDTLPPDYTRVWINKSKK